MAAGALPQVPLPDGLVGAHLNGPPPTVHCVQAVLAQRGRLKARRALVVTPVSVVLLDPKRGRVRQFVELVNVARVHVDAGRKELAVVAKPESARHDMRMKLVEDEVNTHAAPEEVVEVLASARAAVLPSHHPRLPLFQGTTHTTTDAVDDSEQDFGELSTFVQVQSVMQPVGTAPTPALHQPHSRASRVPSSEDDVEGYYGTTSAGAPKPPPLQKTRDPSPSRSPSPPHARSAAAERRGLPGEGEGRVSPLLKAGRSASRKRPSPPVPPRRPAKLCQPAATAPAQHESYPGTLPKRVGYARDTLPAGLGQPPSQHPSYIAPRKKAPVATKPATRPSQAQNEGGFVEWPPMAASPRGQERVTRAHGPHSAGEQPEAYRPREFGIGHVHRTKAGPTAPGPALPGETFIYTTRPVPQTFGVAVDEGELAFAAPRSAAPRQGVYVKPPQKADPKHASRGAAQGALSAYVVRPTDARPL
eukprot:TRINITY_DN7619_c0_g2_i1.p1 TRINITY_DN7619_c0_g2~~TRINITY_DN7619_c0_g2_i1.p1  ORF type:complete len:475 (+),score=108.21 TRINITY_DN7619_c0_g2_i1:78-1502(+)